MFSLTAEYALRAVVYLGERPESRSTIREIAKTAQIPAGYLAKIMQSLARGGVVRAQRGLNGGFLLTRPAAEISLLEVLNAVDPIRRIRECPLSLKAHSSELCPLHHRLDQALAQIEDSFRTSTVADMLDRPTFCPGAETEDGSPTS